MHCWWIRAHSSTPHPLQSKDWQLTAGLASSPEPQGHSSPSAASQHMGRLVTAAVISALSNWPCRNATDQTCVNRLFPLDLCQIQRYTTDACSVSPTVDYYFQGYTTHLPQRLPCTGAVKLLQSAKPSLLIQLKQHPKNETFTWINSGSEQRAKTKAGASCRQSRISSTTPLHCVKQSMKTIPWFTHHLWQSPSIHIPFGLWHTISSNSSAAHGFCSLVRSS